MLNSRRGRMQQVQKDMMCVKKISLQISLILYGPGAKCLINLGFGGVDRFAGYALKILPNNEIISRKCRRNRKILLRMEKKI